MAKDGKKFFVVEMSAGQMVEDVRLAVQDNERVFFHGRMGGGVPTEEEIINKLKEHVK
jgi:2-oxoglutarate ferredoxin oxidoreductase subunit alpha